MVVTSPTLHAFDINVWYFLIPSGPERRKTFYSIASDIAFQLGYKEPPTEERLRAYHMQTMRFIYDNEDISRNSELEDRFLEAIKEYKIILTETMGRIHGVEYDIDRIFQMPG